MAQVARPVGLKALAPDCHLASGELRLPLALADQRLLARGQPAAVGRSPARGRLRAPRRAHHDEPAARLGVGVDTASDSASFTCSATICAVISALVSLGTSGLRFQPRFQRVRMEPARGTTETKRTRLLAGSFAYAPKRTRTSTRLSRTRPSTWRVYQFRHRREGRREYRPGRPLSPCCASRRRCR